LAARTCDGAYGDSDYSDDYSDITCAAGDATCSNCRGTGAAYVANKVCAAGTSEFENGNEFPLNTWKHIAFVQSRSFVTVDTGL
jgi:hypothetical protein